MRILHDPATHRFVIHSREGNGELHYMIARPGVMDFYHVEVDPSIRNRGVASALVSAAFEYARDHHRQVIASCPYVRHWLVSNPQGDLLAPM